MQASGQYKSGLCRETKQLCELGQFDGECLQRAGGSGGEGEGGLGSGWHVGDFAPQGGHCLGCQCQCVEGHRAVRVNMAPLLEASIEHNNVQERRLCIVLPGSCPGFTTYEPT